MGNPEYGELPESKLGYEDRGKAAQRFDDEKEAEAYAATIPDHRKVPFARETNELITEAYLAALRRERER